MLTSGLVVASSAEVKNSHKSIIIKELQLSSRDISRYISSYEDP
jgi:hypothetical protein